MADADAPTAVVAAAKTQLGPLLQEVLDCCQDPNALTFFALLAVQLHEAKVDWQLFDFFIQLSTTAFQGFVFTPEENAVIDALLARAEDIAHTLSAGEAGEPTH